MGIYYCHLKAERTGEKPQEAKVVKLCAMQPPIAKMDNSLNELKSCEYTSNN